MSFLFGRGRGRKSPQDLIRGASASVQGLESPDEKTVEKARKKISETMASMKFMLYGDPETEPRRDQVDRLCDGLFETGVLGELVKRLPEHEFEARKDVAQVFSYVLRQKKAQAVPYVMQNQDILQTLVTGYTDTTIALNCGMVLRECIRHQELCEVMLTTPSLFHPFFDYVQLSTFDVASDAFATFKELLTKHKPVAAQFLLSNFDDVFRRYNVLLLSNNYVTKRQSLKLLGELLLDRSNFKVMMRYINEATNLKIMMNLLRGTTKAIQFEAFHVFKIFVANPQKSRPVTEILLRNKTKLMAFLERFQVEKDDEQFAEEKRILLGALQKLNPASLAAAESKS